MTVERQHKAGSAYQTQLAAVMQRAEALEHHAHNQYRLLDPTNPEYASWQRIERRYATIRGNAHHLLLIHQQRRYRKQPLYHVRKYLNLL